MWDRLQRWAPFHAHRRPHARSEKLTRQDAGRLALFFLLSLTILGALGAAFVRLPRNLHLQQRCRMSRMWPSYVRHDPPSSAGLSAKYRVYLYREAPPGADPNAPPIGRPALFVPGNAGSYGQVRSVASSARHLFEQGEGGQDGSEVDWWAVDFNEDFSAFHGETMLEQAVYLNDVIAYLYAQAYPDLSARGLKIPILAHSMGGIVARLMLLQDNHRNASVETIITLSSPHAYPPVPIEAGLERIYKTIQTDSDRRPSSDTLLVSLSGGVLDDQLSSEGSVLALARLWRREASLYAFTSSLSAVWSGVDHLAMMWCDQVRERIARGFLRIEGNGKALPQRREEWRRMLGMERATDMAHSVLATGLATPQDAEQEPATGSNTERQILQVPVESSDAEKTFELLTSLNVGLDTSFGPPIEQDADVRVLACDAAHTCTTILPSAYDLLPPSSVHADDGDSGYPSFPDASLRYEMPGNGVHRLLLSSKELRHLNAQFVHVEHKQAAKSDFVHAGWVDAPLLMQTLSFPRMTTRYVFEFSKDRKESLSNEVILRSMDSTLLAYTMRVLATQPTPAACSHRDTAPLLRVQSLATGDTQYFPSVRFDKTYKLMLHGTSPFMPPAQAESRGTKFTLLLDSCNEVASLQIALDWTASAGLLLSRYRTAIVALPYAAVMLAASITMEQWNAGAAFPNTLASLYLNAPLLLPLMLGASVAASAVQRVAYGVFDVEEQAWITNLTFGIPASAFFYTLGLTLLLVVASYGVAMMVAAGLDVLIYSMSVVVARTEGREKEASKTPTSTAHVGSRSSVWALATLALLAVATYVIIPIQFVFLVLFLVQWLATSRSTARARSAVQANDHLASQDLANQHRMLLNIFFWLLPLNAPVLLVWTRNLLNGWYGTLGHSDHNILHIIGFVLVAYISCGDEVIPRATMRFHGAITTLLTVRCAAFALLYGIRYTHGLFGATEMLCVWVAWLFFGPRLLAERSDRLASRDRRDSQEVEQLVQTDHSAVHRSTLPASLMDEQHALPSSLQDSRNDAPGYTIPNVNNDADDGGAVALTGLNALLHEYLEALDDYFAVQQSLSDAAARGSFQLSKARMQLGLPYLTRNWDARMKATKGVAVDEDGRMSLTKIKVTPPEEEEATAKTDGEMPTTLRRRVRGDGPAREGEKTADAKGQVAAEKTNEKDDEKRTTNVKPAAPYDPLYQYSALPPPALRHAQSNFCTLLDVLIGPEGGASEQKSLLSITQRLAALEQQIRSERQRTLNGRETAG